MAKRTWFGPKKAKPGAFWVLERKTEVKTGCEQMREDNTRCNIARPMSSFSPMASCTMGTMGLQ